MTKVIILATVCWSNVCFNHIVRICESHAPCVYKIAKTSNGSMTHKHIINCWDWTIDNMQPYSQSIADKFLYKFCDGRMQVGTGRFDDNGNEIYRYDGKIPDYQ